MKFEKWQALGNDYIILEAEALPWPLTGARVKKICDPHFGCSADGVLLLERTDKPGVEARLKIFNPDGSEAELSGNGAREAVLYLKRSGWTAKDVFSLDTAAGEVRSEITSPTTCSIDLGRAKLSSNDFPSGSKDGVGSVDAGGRKWEFQHIHIGNPQCVIDVGDDLESVDIVKVGRDVENAQIFPNRTNVSFIRQDPPSKLSARIFERGVGETLSSGTGASGAAVAAFLKGEPSPITVTLDGGDLLVDITEDLDVRLTGWAQPVFSGVFSDEFVDELSEK